MITALLKSRIASSIADLPIAVSLNGSLLAGHPQAKVELRAHKASTLATLAKPTLGSLARAYVEGDLDIIGSAPDIMSLGQAYCATDASAEAENRIQWRFWQHNLRRSRRDIHYHYDVSNEFYALWLDSQRIYSCAYYADGDETLELAQQKKLAHICRKLRLKAGERFLDIGCGWGGLVFYAVEHFGVKAVGITLSENQYQHVQQVIQARGWQDRLEVRLMDYRTLTASETFDKIASVGMFEHVGRRHLREYFDKIYSLLKPGGLVLNHGITPVAVKSSGLGNGISEFIDDYVFPGGELNHISKVLAELSSSGLEPLDAENLRPHYGRTLWDWVSRLEFYADQAIALIGERRYRIWRIYMAGSAYAFDHNWLALFQVLAGKPDAQGKLDYPYNRSYVYA